MKGRGFCMTKEELIEKVASGTGLSKADARRALTTTISAITSALKKGQSVIFVGFGTFKVSKRKARKGRNPRTGETIVIKAAKVPKFTAGKGLKDAVK
jgi:DNA-binding protein HU-beta